MALICVICIDSLIPTKGQSGASSSNSTEVVVTTLCGHVFHKSCLLRVYNMSEEPQTTVTRRKNVCPTCSTPVDATKLVRIFPSEDDNDSENVQNVKRIQQLKEQISNLREENSSRQSSSRNALYPSVGSETQSETSELTIEELDLTEGGLKRDDVIVWLQEPEKPEVGTVMWLGNLNGKTYAGINFDDRIGNDFPEANKKILFSCVEGHGRLVPVEELILYYDFYDPQYDGNEHRTRGERDEGNDSDDEGAGKLLSEENIEGFQQGIFGFLIAMGFMLLAWCIQTYK